MMHPITFVLMWLCIGVLVVMSGMWLGDALS